MVTKSLIAALLVSFMVLVCATFAAAQPPNGDRGGPGGPPNVVPIDPPDNGDPISGTQTLTQTQTQTQTQGDVAVIVGVTDGDGDRDSSTTVGGQTTTVGGQTTSINVEAPPADTSVTYHGGYRVKTIPPAYAPSVHPTAPCMGSVSVGGSGVGFGFSAGTTWRDDDCGIRETARSFANMDMHDDAVAVLCSSEYASRAPACIVKVRPAERVTAAPAPASGYASSGFRYSETGNPVCAFDPILAHRSQLPRC